MGTTSGTLVQGHVEEGWGKVADVFRENFEERPGGSPGEVGAACCVYVDGRPVVDLWGGLADREANRPWDKDTIVAVASTTKGATAICAHLLVQRGELDLDAPVVKYWPEFGAAGKEHIPVRWLLSHQAGLPVIDGPLTFQEPSAPELAPPRGARGARRDRAPLAGEGPCEALRPRARGGRGARRGAGALKAAHKPRGG